MVSMQNTSFVKRAKVCTAIYASSHVSIVLSCKVTLSKYNSSILVMNSLLMQVVLILPVLMVCLTSPMLTVSGNLR